MPTAPRVAFAAVEGDGTLTDIPGGAFNITQAQVTHFPNGQYCFAIPGPRSAVATASDGGGGFAGNLATVEINPQDTGGDCTVRVNIRNTPTRQ